MTKPLELEARLYQMLNSLGVKVEKDSKLASDSEPMIVVGTPYQPGAPTIPGTVQAVCTSCEGKVNIAPSSQRVIEQRKKLGNEVKILCLSCLANQSSN